MLRFLQALVLGVVLCASIGEGAWTASYGGAGQGSQWTTDASPGSTFTWYTSPGANGYWNFFNMGSFSDLYGQDAIDDAFGVDSSPLPSPPLGDMPDGSDGGLTWNGAWAAGLAAIGYGHASGEESLLDFLSLSEGLQEQIVAAITSVLVLVSLLLGIYTAYRVFKKFMLPEISAPAWNPRAAASYDDGRGHGGITPNRGETLGSLNASSSRMHARYKLEASGRAHAANQGYRSKGWSQQGTLNAHNHQARIQRGEYEGGGLHRVSTPRPPSFRNGPYPGQRGGRA